MLLALELADAGLIALPEEGETAAPSPGIAIVDGESIITGRAADAKARLTPRRVHNRFWSEISTEIIGGSFGPNLRTADLAWTHLHQLWQEVGHGVDGVTLVLPGGYDERRISLILGVARSAGLPVDGLVDASVASSIGRVSDGPAIHLDLELHRAVLSIVDPGPRRTMVHLSEGIGLAKLNDLWLRWVAGVFLKTTRYDPLHSARGEQDLADQLPAILGRLATRDSISVSLKMDDTVFTVDLSREAAVTVASNLYAELDPLMDAAGANHPTTLLVSSRAAMAPGLSQRVSHRSGLEATTLPLAAAAAGALDCSSRIRSPGSALPLITDLGNPGVEEEG
jgi:hypothetical protein